MLATAKVSHAPCPVRFYLRWMHVAVEWRRAALSRAPRQML